MGLGFCLRGVASASGSDDLLGRMAAWFDRHAAAELLRAHVGTDSENRPTLFLALHPSAEDVEIVDAGGGTLLATAKTSTTGPGYHAYLCDLMDAVAHDCGITWQPPDDEAFDETGYFHARDDAALENEFVAWLGGLAGMLLETAAKGGTGFVVSMPIDVRFECDAFLTTPVGPRSVEWTREVATNPRLGLDIFPWWERGKGAKCALGRALCHMWVDVPWRPPVDDSERLLLSCIDALLASAQGEDPGLALPVTEWMEIRADLRSEGDAGAPAVRRGNIGYRRRVTWNALSGGWSLRAPGGFVGRFDEDGTWSAFDGQRTLWFSSFRVGDGGERPKNDRDLLSSGPLDGDPVELALAPLPYRASVKTRDDGDGAGPYRILQAEVASLGSLAVLTVAFSEPGDLELAVRIASTLARRTG
jgi:hypothetical protein